MAKILSLRKEKSGILSVMIEDESVRRLSVTDGDYIDAGAPSVGEELTSDALAVLTEADERRRAFRKAMSILSYSDRSERMLFQKLRAAGFSRDVAEEAVKEAVGLGYIKEEEQIERQIELELRSRLSGQARILARLAAKGFPSGKSRQVLDEMVKDGRVDFHAMKEELLATLPEDADENEKRKILAKHGFTL